MHLDIVHKCKSLDINRSRLQNYFIATSDELRHARVATASICDATIYVYGVSPLSLAAKQ